MFSDKCENSCSLFTKLLNLLLALISSVSKITVRTPLSKFFLLKSPVSKENQEPKRHIFHHFTWSVFASLFCSSLQSVVPEGLEPIVSPSDKGDVEAESGLVNGTHEDSTREDGTGDREENMEVSGDSKEQKQEGSTEEGDAEEKGEVDEGTEHVEEEKQEDVEEQKDEGGTGGDEVDSKAEEETEGAPSDEREEEKADDDEMKADDEATEELSGEKEDMVDVEEEKEE